MATKVLAACALALIVAAGAIEARTSFLQSLIFTRFAGALTYDVRPGPSAEIGFPIGGPQDKRLGYSDLPAHISALRARNFRIARQASWSPELKQFAADHGYAVYREKNDAGLTLLGRTGKPFYRARYPERVYENFDAVPPIVVATLRFIEDRSLLDPNNPRRDPAVNWKRLAFATAGLAGGWFDPRLKRGGASTLATQIEKYRHYPDGLTRSVDDKLDQMLSAATRSYLEGPETIGAQQDIATTFLNSTPLSARPGYGEVIGVPEGLWAWYGTDVEEANSLLSDTKGSPSARKAEVYKQVLSLLLAQRRPSYYLLNGRDALAALADNYLSLLAEAGVIDAALEEAALRAKLNFLAEAPPAPLLSFVKRKAATSVQTQLLQLLGTSSLYDLDRLDVTANTTFDADVQEQVSDVLARLDEREEVAARGLVGPNLLGSADLSRVNFSVVVYERGKDRNYLRVHADSLNQPFDINSGSKLILGSTAKLRTVVTYLDIMTRLHERFAKLSSHELWAEVVASQDPLTHWAAAYLAQASDRSLQPMLDAALQRRYSASPAERFFTGGGIHVFSNYQSSDNDRRPTVKDAIVHSINLVFIRVMRDIRDYYIAEDARDEAAKGESEESAREKYLRRFADQEGRTFLSRFYDDMGDLAPGDIVSSLAGQSGHVPQRLAVLFRSIEPAASVEELRAFLAKELPGDPPGERMADALYRDYGRDRYSLLDRAYLAHVHPLRLWLAEYLKEHPGASRPEILAASETVRQDAYRWLFESRYRRAQDSRIRTIREQDAFEHILRDWHKQGYPFDYLVPSLATAIGSSGDRPDALATLMGIILNDGVELPTVDIERLEFAAGTPYETEMALAPDAPKRIIAPEIALAVRGALSEVVSRGTGTRFRGAFSAPDGKPLAMGGKTGTGDNRFETFGPGHELVDSRVVDRTATFVFYLGDRFYGTVTAFVTGPEAAKYHFTSSLAVQLLKSLAPELRPLIETSQMPDIAGNAPKTPTRVLAAATTSARP